MQLKILSKEKIIYEAKNARGVTCVTPKGVTTMLDGHVNFVSQVKMGPLKVSEQNGEIFETEIASGTIMIENNQANILISPKIENTKDMVEEAAQNAVDLIEGNSGKEDDYDYARVLGEIQKELLNLRRRK